MSETVARETQAEAVLLVLREAHQMGWAEVRVEVTRGGTMAVDAKRDAGAKVVKPAFTSGLRK